MIRYPVPKNPRQTFQLFRFYDKALGIDSVLDRIRWTPVSSMQVYAAVLGRLPESRKYAIPAERFPARQSLHDALHSEEFQIQITRNLLRAFPEKQRVLFVHIPRTAGTDLEQRLAETMPHIHQSMQSSAVVPKPKLFEHLREFAQNIDLGDRILACGHQSLSYYVDSGLRRFEDQLVTVIRDPIDLLISHANYIVTVLRGDDRVRADRQIWLRQLDLPDVPQGLPDEEGRNLAVRVLRSEALTPQDPLCNFLGTGTEESALDLVAMSNTEITDVNRYSDWLKERWGIHSDDRKNRSATLLLRQHLSADDLAMLNRRTSKDRPLYGRIMERLEKSGKLSISGLSLAAPGNSRRAT